jgi:D-alanyl-D-alanine carboxypeptidase (penicillin-binding protein 5/6)
LPLLATLLVLAVAATAGVSAARDALRVKAHGSLLQDAASEPPITFSRSWLYAHPAPALGLKAQSAILVDLDRRQVLWELDPASVRAPASLTKMMTAMIAVDHAGLDQLVTVPVAAAAVEPNHMGLSAGEQVPVRDVLYGLFLDSGNDAAETLAGALLPRARFLAEMNARAALLGLRETRFSNPTGLDDPGLHSSARDLAVLAAYLELHYPELKDIASTRQKWIPAAGWHGAYAPYNLNKLLWSYAGADGLKTGLTDDAGGCVAASATRGGRHLLAIVLHSDVFFTDAARLLDYGFATQA